MRQLLAATALSAYLYLLGGCGQTGPLYLPGDEPPITVEPAEVASEQGNETE